MRGSEGITTQMVADTQITYYNVMILAQTDTLASQRAAKILVAKVFYLRESNIYLIAMGLWGGWEMLQSRT
jgi:hypothetical protein